MNHSHTFQRLSAESETIPNSCPQRTTHPPGTRDACPIRLRAVRYAVTSSLSGLYRRNPKGEAGWGSRLGCRAGGQQNQPVICRPADNPFASHRVEGLAYRCNGSGLDAIRRRLEEIGGRGAIVGAKGSGKTTLLEELAAALPGEPVHVRIGGGCGYPWRTVHAQLPTPVTPNHAVLVDGGEQLGPLGWRLLLRATRSARNFVATQHRQGRLPTLIECRTDHALLGNLVEELTPEDAPMLEPGLDELFQRHEGNIRSCLRELYDVYAGRTSFQF